MTLPFERTYAVLGVRNWLEHLARTPGRISKTQFRRQVYLRLKHYPTEGDMLDPARAFRKAQGGHSKAQIGHGRQI